VVWDLVKGKTNPLIRKWELMMATQRYRHLAGLWCQHVPQDVEKSIFLPCQNTPTHHRLLFFERSTCACNFCSYECTPHFMFHMSGIVNCHSHNYWIRGSGIVIWGPPFHHGMARSRVAEIWRIGANIMEKLARTADKGWSSRLRDR
jgi:hypothetical protein